MFSYTQRAIRSGCLDYILKPVIEEELISVLRKVSNLNRESVILRKNREKLEDAYHLRVLRHLIRGKYNDEDIEYANKHLMLSGDLRFIEIDFVNREMEEDNSDSDDLSVMQRQLFNTCRDTLKEYANHFAIDFSYDEDNYSIGFIYCDRMASISDMTDAEFLNALIRKIEVLILKPIRMLCGQPVSDISALSKSFDSCRGLRSIAGFHNTKKLYFYEETEDNHGSIVLFKKTIDEIIIDIEKNDPALIEKNIVKLYEEIKGKEGMCYIEQSLLLKKIGKLYNH